MEHLGTFERALHDRSTFAVTWEIVPGRGAVEAAQDAAVRMAGEAAAGGKVHAVSITDNPGGGPALSAEMLGVEIVRLGIEPLVHFTCKDKNRSQMESLLHGLERAQVRNLLVMTGDYPKGGFAGQAKPVFDLDPTMVLDLVTAMNRGLEVPGAKGPTRLAPAHFVAGAACSPFKAVEAEQMGQYYKLRASSSRSWASTPASSTSCRGWCGDSAMRTSRSSATSTCCRSARPRRCTAAPSRAASSPTGCCTC